MRAKIEKLQRATCSSGSYSFLVSQPPELVLNGVSRCAEFGGDFAEHEALRTHGEQLLYGEGVQGYLDINTRSKSALKNGRAAIIT